MQWPELLFHILGLFLLIRNFYFFPDFQEMRPAGSEKHKNDLAWPEEVLLAGGGSPPEASIMPFD